MCVGMDSWAQKHRLTAATLATLREDGFDSLEEMSLLTPDDVDKLYTDIDRLPLDQRLCLKRAVKELSNGKTQGQAVNARSTGCHGAPGRTSQESKAGHALRFLLVGKTGCGKSTTGNTILGMNLFDSDVSFERVTSTCSLKRGTRNGVTIEIMDTPGFFDTGRTYEEVASDVFQAVACMHPGPTAVLYTVMIGNRYTQEESGVYERLKALLDPRVTDYMIVLFTRGDDLKRRKKTIQEDLSAAPENLRKVLDECGHRYVVFDNTADDKQSQVEGLLEKVWQLMEAHGGVPYTCPKYGEVSKWMEQEVTKRLQFEKKQREMEEEIRRKDMERAQQLEAMMEALKQQQLSPERMHEKEMEYRREMEAARMREMQETERQRRKEMAAMEQRQHQLQDLYDKRMEAEREYSWRGESQRHQTEMGKTRNHFAKNSNVRWSSV